MDEAKRRLRVLEVGPTGEWTVRATVPLTLDTVVEVGREAEIEVGPEDPMMSRIALTVTPTVGGWDFSVTNRHGGTIHPWGQRPYPAERGDHRTSWPLVGIRFLAGDGGPQHWVLLEATEWDVTDASRGGPLPDRPGTPTATRPAGDEKLTDRQLAALEAVFEPHLTWPPPTGPTLPGLQKQAARRLGVSENAVQQRLSAARDKAIRLGLTEQVELPDPTYLFVLVRAGLVPFPRFAW